MFKLDGNIKFINIDSDYVKKLNLACPEVYYKSIGYDNKPYIGILINEVNRSYVIPLSSAKEKHKSWKNVNQECYLVYEYALKSKMGDADIWVQSAEESIVKHIMSVIHIKKMIPIKSGVYREVNMNKDNSDTQVTFCKGLFNQIHRKFTFQGKKIEPGTCFLDSWLISAIYIFWSVFNFLTSSTERPTNSAIFSSVIVPSSSIFFATFIIPSFNV